MPDEEELQDLVQETLYVDALMGWDGDKLTTDPVVPGTRPIFHRGYHVELAEEVGGWFSQGEVLLRSDGVLFKRSVPRWFGPNDGPISPWTEEAWWQGGTDAAALWRELDRRGYDLHGDVFPL